MRKVDGNVLTRQLDLIVTDQFESSIYQNLDIKIVFIIHLNTRFSDN